MMKKICEITSNLCIRAADWISLPISIIILPIVCVVYLMLGGAESRLTLILSILAITITQMILRAQAVDTEMQKLQMAELIRAIPEARNEVIQEEKLTHSKMTELREEIKNEIS